MSEEHQNNHTDHIDDPAALAERRQRRSYLIFLLLPLMCGLIFCAAQVGLILSQPNSLERDIDSLETADYGPWEVVRFGQVDPRIVTELALESIPSAQATIVVAASQTALQRTQFPQTSTPITIPEITPISTNADPEEPTFTFTPEAEIAETATATTAPTVAREASVTSTITLTHTVMPSPTTIPPTIGQTPPPTVTSVIIPPPIASFHANPLIGEAPLTVAFTNTSSGSISSYSWDFGDGSGFDTSVSPSHVYAASGTYTVTLTVTGPGGSSSAQAIITATMSMPPTDPPVPTITNTPAQAATVTATSTVTATPTITSTIVTMLTVEVTTTTLPTATATPTPIVSFTPTTTNTPTASATATQTTTSTATATATNTPTNTSTPTTTNTPAPSATPEPVNLRLTGMCSDDPATVLRWRVRNPNWYDVPFDWGLFGKSQNGSDIAPAADVSGQGEMFFFTNTEPDSVMIIRFFGSKTVTKSANTSQCSGP